jgi:hypothetical protein
MDSQSSQKPSGNIPVVQLPQSDTPKAEHASSSHAGRTWTMVLLIPLLVGGAAGILSKYGTELSRPKAQVVVPLNVVATCRVVNNNPRVEVSWNRPTDITDQVLTKKSSNGDFVTVAQGADLQAYADVDVRFGEQYIYQVSLGKAGVSEDVTLLLTPQQCKVSPTPSVSPSPKPTPKKK